MTDRNRRPTDAPQPYHVRPREIWLARAWLEQESTSNPWRRAERELWGGVGMTARAAGRDAALHDRYR